MFQVRNGRLYPDLAPQGISIAVPEGFWINTDHAGEAENRVTLFTADRGADATLTFGKMEEGSAEAEMEAFLEAVCETAVPRPISFGGFGGVAATCMGGTEEMIILDISGLGLCRPGGGIAGMLEIDMSADTPEGLKAALETEFAALLGGIRKEMAEGLTEERLKEDKDVPV